MGFDQIKLFTITQQLLQFLGSFIKIFNLRWNIRFAKPAVNTAGKRLWDVAKSVGSKIGNLAKSAWGAIKNVGGTVSLVGTVTETIIVQDAGAAGWAVTITADDTNKSLEMAFTGSALVTAEISTVEVGI